MQWNVFMGEAQRMAVSGLSNIVGRCSMGCAAPPVMRPSDIGRHDPFPRGFRAAGQAARTLLEPPALRSPASPTPGVGQRAIEASVRRSESQSRAEPRYPLSP
uniref:Uncharacterized protein n=1 Tax=Ralstonia solanacearum TaxID=305 RepID=A0A0S4TPK9_RALSL|nr:protein of unknown function [Ralstonia solanacearum]